MHGADNDTFINLTSSSVTESAARAGTAHGELERVEGEGASRSGTQAGEGAAPALPFPPLPTPDRLNQALMDQRDASADEIRAAVRASRAERTLQPSPRCALFRRGPFNSLLFAAHGADLNVNTLSRMR